MNGKQGKGFEISTSAGARVAIASAEISGDKVIITCATIPGPVPAWVTPLIADARNVRMMTPYPGTFRWGLLRDSDPFKGINSNKVQPNYCVAFETDRSVNQWKLPNKNIRSE